MLKVLMPLELEMCYLKISASVAGVEAPRGGRGGVGRSVGGSDGEMKGKRGGRQGA